MTTLLEHSRQNRNKGRGYDDILKLFGKANDTRNEYLHGLWYTHESGETFLQKPTVDQMGLGPMKPVTAKAMDTYIKQLMQLQTLVYLTLSP